MTVLGKPVSDLSSERFATEPRPSEVRVLPAEAPFSKTKTAANAVSPRGASLALTSFVRNILGPWGLLGWRD